MSEQPKVRPEVVSKLVSKDIDDQTIESATATERQAARDYLVRAIGHNEDQAAAGRRALEMLLPYADRLPQNPTVGEVMAVMTESERAELSDILDRIAPDGLFG